MVASLRNTEQIINTSVHSTDAFSPLVNLYGVQYCLTVYHKKAGQSEWVQVENVNQLLNDSTFQDLIKQVKSPCSEIEIQASVYQDSAKNSVHCVITENGSKRKLNLSTDEALFTRISHIFEKTTKDQTNHPIKINGENDFRSWKNDFVNQWVEESVSYSQHKPSLEEDEPLDSSKTAIIDNKEEIKILAKSVDERVMGLGRIGSNCCINAALQIILNDPSLRALWRKHFKEAAEIYDKALHANKPFAPAVVTQKFRKLLSDKSRLVSKRSVQEEASYVLEAFFDICQKEGLDVSSVLLCSKTKKYTVFEEERELDWETSNRTCLMPITVEQSNSTTKLEELIKKNCLSTTEAEGKKSEYNTKYTSIPNSLIIHYSEYGKDAANISTPMEFTFPVECTEDLSTHEYELKAFIVHLGKDHKSGHYIACRKVNGQWKKFDDSEVKDIEETELRQALLGNSRKQSILGYPKPYVCMVSYTKK